MSTTKRTNGRYALPRPFLKWVGGKGQLLPELMKRIEKAGDFGRYHEPFVGGGALFYELHRAKKLGRRHAWLSDDNPRLIEAYEGVKDHVDEVIAFLQKHKLKHSEEYYYDVRSRVPRTLPGRAARIIYLNKTCFNGLYRENRKSEFNSPFGRYKNPQICDEANLRAASKALKKAKLEACHFEYVLKKAKPGDLVYFDPPYVPISKTSSFTSYTPQTRPIDQGHFGEDSHRLLALVVTELSDAGVKVLLSNSMTPFVRDIYKDFIIDEVRANRAVNSRADRRGKVSEALVRNF